MIDFFKGILFGFANIVPGLSGGTIAVSLGIYEKLINIFSDIKNEVLKNKKFLALFVSGAVFAIALGSSLISFLFESYQFLTIMFFVGVIIGGIPMIFKKVKSKIYSKDVIFFILSFALVLFITFLNNGVLDVSIEFNLLYIIILFLIGVIVASTMVIPGLSGSFILLLIGFYYPIVKIVSDFFKFENVFINFVFLFSFGIGLILGIIFISKLIRYLISKYEVKSYFAILGFVCASIISMLESSNFRTCNINLSLGIFIMFVGFLLVYRLGDVK